MNTQPELDDFTREQVREYCQKQSAELGVFVMMINNGEVQE